MTEETHNKKEEQQDKEDSHWIPEPSPVYQKTSSSKSTNAAGESEPKEDMHPDDMPEKNTTIRPILAPITQSEERTWAMIAHFSVLLNLVTGFLGGIAAIIIYFSYKDRSRLVAYHAMQSFLFQTITWLGAGMLAGLFIGLGSAFAILIIPLLCLIPGFLFLLLLPVSLIYGTIGGVKVNNGEDFRYWQVGDWVREILEPKPIPGS